MVTFHHLHKPGKVVVILIPYFRNEESESERESDLAKNMQIVKVSVSTSPKMGEVLEVVENLK